MDPKIERAERALYKINEQNPTTPTYVESLREEGRSVAGDRQTPG